MLIDSEVILLKKTQKGCSRSFEILYKKYNRFVRSQCRKFMQENDVDDLVQQIFFEVWKSLKRFEFRSSFFTWLTRVSINICLEAKRKRKGREEFFSQKNPYDSAKSLPNYQSRGAKTPWDNFLTKMQKKQLNQVYLALPKQKRMVFFLSFIQGYKAMEISQIMKIPEATVRTRIHYSRKDLMKALQTDPYFEFIS